MVNILLALTLASHDPSPYGWHMTCEAFTTQRLEIMSDPHFDHRTKMNLIAYLRTKVEGECNQMLV